MATYKLHYFNVYGRAEIIRLIFTAAGIEYEDVRLKRPQWREIKESSPTGYMPYLEIDGEILSQSLVIARYMAKVTGMAGQDDFEQAQVDEIAEHWIDLQYELSTAKVEADYAEKEEKLKMVMEDICPKKMLLMEEFLKKNDDGNGFFIGKHLTWADLQSIIVIGLFFDEHEDEVKKFPKLYAHYNRVVGLPKITEYLANRLHRDY